MTNKSDEPQCSNPLNHWAAARHDGWSGDKMAKFCEVLAETAVVAEACGQAGMGISGAYALRRRNAFFAAAWDASLTIARERLADTLLARSMEGNIEQIWRGGEVVGERHVLDNRLGLAILRRLDRLAETGMTVSTRGERAVALDRDPKSPAIRHPRSIDWELALTALRTGEEGVIAEALAMFQGHKVEEVEDPLVSVNLGHGDNADDEGLDLTDRCWRDAIEDIWMTDFPPPPGFTGYENRPYDEDDEEEHQRACAPEEVAVLEASRAAERAAERAEEEQLRDEWFKFLKTDLDTRGDPDDQDKF